MTKRSSSSLKFLSPLKVDFLVHPKAKSAYEIWLKVFKKTSYVNIQKIDKYYKPLIRIIQKNSNQVYYFYSFSRMAEIQQFESREQHQFVITTENDLNITKMAWAEVLKISGHKETNHQLLWQELTQHCAPSILKELMGCGKLRKEDYCSFANITVEHYEYQQRIKLDKERALGLPQNLNWIEDDE